MQCVCSKLSRITSSPFVPHSGPIPHMRWGGGGIVRVLGSTSSMQRFVLGTNHTSRMYACSHTSYRHACMQPGVHVASIDVWSHDCCQRRRVFCAALLWLFGLSPSRYSRREEGRTVAGVLFPIGCIASLYACLCTTHHRISAPLSVVLEEQRAAVRPSECLSV